MTIEALQTHQTENKYRGDAFTQLEEALRAIQGAADTLMGLACCPGPQELVFAFLGEHLGEQHDRAYEAFDNLVDLLRKKAGHEE